MNIKKTVKKMTAVLAGATMLGATVMGAMAMDLGDYPAPLITNGVWDGKVVVGAVAAAEDIAGAASLAAGLQTYSRVPVSVGGGSISVEGGYDFQDLALNAAFPSAEMIFDDRDLAGFQDKTIRWDGNDVRVSEQLVIGQTDLEVVTSLGNGRYEEYGINSYLNVNQGAVEYRYLFETDINVSRLPAEPLTIEFLGREIEISQLGAESMTLQTASVSGVLSRGDTFTADGKTITVITIHTGGALLEVGGVRKNVPYSSTGEQPVDVGGVDVVIDDHVYIESEPEFNFVVLKAGNDITETVGRLSGLTIFGEDEDDPEWIWDWNITEGNQYIAAVLDIGRSMTPEEIEYADERPALGYGESLMLPNNYGAVTFEGYMDAGYNEVTMTFRSMRLLNDEDVRTASANFLVISTNSDRAPFRFGDIRADSIFISQANATHLTLGYEADGERRWAENGTAYTFSDLSLQLVRGQAINITGEALDNVSFNFGGEKLTFAIDGYTGFVEEGLAHTDDAALGGVEYGVRTTYGVTFTNPDSMLDSGRFVMRVPHEAAEPVVVVSGPDTVTRSVGGTGAYQVVPIPPADVGVLDREVLNMVGQTPMLVVGGPNANTVAARLLNVEQFSDEVADMFQPNRAMIRLFENQNAILVAGYEGKDTRAAALALANFAQNRADFQGNKEVEVVVSGTSVSAINAPRNN
jgi:hypothetical protein